MRVRCAHTSKTKLKMSDFVAVLKQKLEEIQGLEGAEFAQKLKQIEDEASASPQLHSSPYNIRQFELLLKPQRERAKRGNALSQARAFSMKPVSLTSPTPPSSLPPVVTVAATVEVTNPPNEIFNASEFGNADLVYTKLTDSVIYIAPEISLSALTLSGLTRCKVYVAGTVLSSLMARDCVECDVYVRSAQARIHTCTESRFFLQCGTAPVIEKCKALQFGAYTLHTTSPIPSEAVDHPPYQVKDFNWLKPSIPSPNWTWMITTTSEKISGGDKWTIWT